jgi:hypothetical protein
MERGRRFLRIVRARTRRGSGESYANVRSSYEGGEEGGLGGLQKG